METDTHSRPTLFVQLQCPTMQINTYSEGKKHQWMWHLPHWDSPFSVILALQVQVALAVTSALKKSILIQLLVWNLWLLGFEVFSCISSITIYVLPFFFFFVPPPPQKTLIFSYWTSWMHPSVLYFLPSYFHFYVLSLGPVNSERNLQSSVLGYGVRMAVGVLWTK